MHIMHDFNEIGAILIYNSTIVNEFLMSETLFLRDFIRLCIILGNLGL